MPTSRKNDRNWRTVSEIAGEEGITDRTVRLWCEAGKLHALKTVGGQWRIYRDADELTTARKSSFVLAALALLV